MSKVLVTGATGKIGSQLVSMLVDRGVQVRAGVRSPERAAAPQGAELVRFDYEDPATLPDALAGVERLFLLAPPLLLEPPRIRALIDVARHAGVRSIVKVSSLGAALDSPVWLGRVHAETDAMVRDSGLAWTLVMPGFFMDNYLTFALDTIRSEGAFYGASAEGKVSWISSRDIAEVCSAALLAPSHHAGQEYLLTGPQALSCTEVAALFSEVSGRPIKYVDVPPAQFRSAMIDGGMPPRFADSLVALEAIKARGQAAMLSPSVEQVLGRPPEAYRTFLTRHRARLV